MALPGLELTGLESIHLTTAMVTGAIYFADYFKTDAEKLGQLTLAVVEWSANSP